MGSRRAQRVGTLLHHALGTLLIQDTKDPRLQGVTVTAVDMSPDLRHARVFYRIIGPGNPQRTQQGLERASGYLQGVVGRELRLRYIPELRFVFDPAPERAQRVEELLGSDRGGGPEVNEDLDDGYRRHSTRR